MRIHSFDWDEKNENHIAEHGVNVFEVEEAILFSRPFYQRSREDKYIAYSVSEGKYLFIVFVIKDSGRIRVISAREMDEEEKRYYKKNRKGVR